MASVFLHVYNFILDKLWFLASYKALISSPCISVMLLIGWKGSLPCHWLGAWNSEAWSSGVGVCCLRASCREAGIHPISLIIYSSESAISNRTMKISSYPFSLLLHHGKNIILKHGCFKIHFTHMQCITLTSKFYTMEELICENMKTSCYIT